MPKWIQLPAETLKYQPSQQAFLEARRSRVCPKCKIEFQAVTEPVPSADCPKCGTKGKRLFDRLTIIAGRRFGKTRIGAVAAAEEATIPHSIVWCCAPTNPKLHRYVIPAMQELIPESWVQSWSTEFNDLRLKNGSLIHFQTLEDPDQGRGQGLDALWIDEVCELSLKHWDVIRPSLAGDTVAFFTTSPRGYDWVYDELYAPAETGIFKDGSQASGYWAVLAKTRESANPRISSEFLARERSQMSETMYRQEYEADFVTFTGSVYGEHLHSHHILRDEQAIRKLIPRWPDVSDLPVLVGIDTGADHPFGAIKLVSTEQGLVVIGEYLERDKSFIEHAAALKRLAANSHARYAINKNERQGMIEFAQHAINCSPANNDQVAGIERVKSWLHVGQLYFFEPKCPQLIRQMKAYRWAENVSPKDNAQRKERVFKKDDELPDCLRYALMTWPILPKPKEAETPMRDISQMSPDQQRFIMRERRAEGRAKEEEQLTVDEFWL